MKTCQTCTSLQDGICTQHHKPPPPDFAEKCRHYDHDEAAVVAPERVCANCERYDKDELGEWCLFAIEADCVTFRPLGMVEGCPLENIEESCHG